MSATALALVLAAAFVHATWNLLAKRVSATTSAPAFVWLYGTLSALLYTPPALWLLLQRDHVPLGWRELGVMTGSALVHLAYFLVLQRGYRSGDLSVVYPLARGTGPLLSGTVAVIFLGERPTPVAIAGALAIAASVFLFASPGAHDAHVDPDEARRRRRHGIAFGLGTGLLIALYTVWDKYAVATLHIPPLLMEWATCLARAVLLAPLAIAQWPHVRDAFARHRAEAVAIGVLNPLSYLLVMIALVTTPVSYVAPAREVSILIGAAMGSRFLGEGDARRRIFAAALMLSGVIALSVG
jgi:drug/metabolite transporter (DMT)-like permease